MDDNKCTYSQNKCAYSQKCTERPRSTLSLCLTCCVLEKLSLDQNCLNRGQCYLSWCNFANNSTQRGQYYVINGSKIVA